MASTKMIQQEFQTGADEKHGKYHVSEQQTGNINDATSLHDEKSPDIDGPYGWVVVGAVFMAGFIYSLCIDGFGILYVEFSEVFQQPKMVLGWVGSVEAFMETFLGIATSVVVTRFGCRPVFIPCVILMALGYLLSAFTMNVPMLCVTYGLFVGSGYSGIAIARTLIVALYFSKYRPLAMGMSLMGMAFGTVASPMVMRTLLDYYGWRSALIMLSALILQTLPFVCLLRPPCLTKRGKQAQETSLKNETGIGYLWKGLIDFSLLRRLDMKLYCFSAMMFPFSFYTYFHHLPSRIVAKGLSLRESSLIPTYMAAALIIVRLLASIISNLQSCDSVLIYTGTILVGGFVMVIISLSPSVTYMIINAVAFGGVTGSYYAINVISLVELVGPSKLARAQGISMLFVSPICLVATPLAGLLYDVSGNYDIPFYVMGCFVILGGASMLPVCFQRCKTQHPVQTIATDSKQSSENIKMV